MVRCAALVALALAVVSCSEHGTINPILKTGTPQFVVNTAADGVRISEIHYDNVSTDVDERVEISGPAGTSLAGWKILSYNGSPTQRNVAATFDLSGTITASCNGRGVLVFNTAGLQNGNGTQNEPDGIALVNPSNQVVEFLTWEGSFTALSGTAAGQTSTNIGVVQVGTEPAGSSLQRKNAAGEWFVTTPLGTNTFGTCNDNPGIVIGPITRVTITPSTQTILTNKTFKFTAEAFDANNNKVTNATFTWTSGDENVAAHPVNGEGVGLQASPAEGITITATANNVPGTATLIVREPPPLSQVRFTELHYDNSATNDPGEGIEIEGPAGADLTGWKIVLYNGNTPYNERTLTGRIIERCNGRGVLHVPYGPVTNGAIQNGPADGFALIDADGGLIEFFSYEGVITDPTGAAAGVESVDIGVAESNSTAPGTSLWRDAVGTWQPSAPHSFGRCNEGDVPPPPPVTLVITEVMARPTVADANGEWFEVYNPNNTSVDVTGFVIASTTSDRGPESHTIASNVVIPAKGFVVFGSSTDQSLNGNVPVTYAYGSTITMSNSTLTEQIELRDAAGQTIDLVTYNGLLPTLGRSRYVLDHTQDNTNWNNFNWDELEGGTPGAGDYGERGPVATITVTADAPFVSTTGSRQFRARAQDAQGRVVATAVTWTSSNAAAATIDASGLARGAAVGTTNITATAANGVFGSAELKVLAPGTPAYTTVTPADPVPPAGYQRRVFYNVFDADGAAVANVSPSQISWSTSDAVVATVNVELGDRAYMTGHQAGSVRIIATHTPTGATGYMQTNIQPHSVATSAVYRYHLEFGTPTDTDSSDDLLGNRSQFSFSYNPVRGSPNWVSWNINKTQFGPVPRCDCFSEDASLPEPRVHDVDYINSGYSRGHMVQSESRTTTTQENAATFLMSNIVPQAANNNEGPWLKFENYLNDLARQQNKEIYVIAGGEYGPSPETLNNAGKIQIPEYTWKVAVILDAGEGLLSVNGLDDLRVLAIRIPNLLAATVDIKPDPWEKYEVTVDAIEAAVGYNVLDALADQIEIAVESKTKPPVARVDGPYTQTEGVAVTLSGATSSDPDAGQTLTYSWNFGDGNTATGSAVTHTYAQDGNYTITLTVTDPLGLTSTTTTSASISNAAPVIAAFNGATLLPGETYSVNGSFTDAGTDTWTATVDYGAGAGAAALTLTGQTFALSQQYNTAGTFTVTVTVTDDDVSSTKSVTVTVLSVDQAFAKAIAAVDLLVSTGKINNGVGTSLRSKIENAQKSFVNENTTPAANLLNAVLNELDALVSSNRLSAADAAALRDVVTRLIQSITR